MMGRSPAILPVDRRYGRNHMWAGPAGGVLRIGLSAYAVRLLGDIRHLEWSVESGDELADGQQIGYVEASKATSDLFAPLAGEVVAINEEVLARPNLVNSNLYDSGWLMEISGNGEGLLTAQEYDRYLAACWPLAQRLLKGQAGNTSSPPPS